MSDTHAIIAGSFADLKLIKTRSTAQLIIEIPIEQADAALRALGGVPQAGKENPVAVARLAPNVARTAPKPSDNGGDGSGAGKHRLSQQAALCCQDARFMRFLEDELSVTRNTLPNDAADYVRLFCGVQSRAEFDSNPEAAARWRELHGRYIAWREAA